MKFTIIPLVCVLILSVFQSAVAKEPLGMDGLVCFWDFHEEAGKDRVAKGPFPYKLEEMGGEIARTEGGPFGEFSVRIKAGQWFRIPNGKFPALDFHGPEAQVSVVAWVKREVGSSWQAVAGVWDETHKQRQYCLFINGTTRSDSRTMTRTPCKHLVHGHVSDVGGPTAGNNFCITYSTSPTPVPVGEWEMVAMTYDGEFSRAFVGGKFSADEGRNPFPLEGGLFDGDGEFTVGAVDRGGEIGNFFNGTLGGLAVFSRALSEEELKTLAEPK